MFRTLLVPSCQSIADWMALLMINAQRYFYLAFCLVLLVVTSKQGKHQIRSFLALKGVSRIISLPAPSFLALYQRFSSHASTFSWIRQISHITLKACCQTSDTFIPPSLYIYIFSRSLLLFNKFQIVVARRLVLVKIENSHTKFFYGKLKPFFSDVLFSIIWILDLLVDHQ